MMPANRKLEIFSVEGIVAALKPNVNYQVSNLATRFSSKPGDIRRQLENAVEAGLMDRVRDHGEICYRLVWSDEQPQKVGNPYRNLRLGETLEGYSASLFSFANLCMTVRR